MKLQTVIFVLISLVAPMAVASEEMFGNYPYCSGCEAKYENEDGQWNYIDHTWCKVNEEKCNGEWSIENNDDNDWSMYNSLPEFTDVSIELYSWLDLMPGMTIPGEKKEAYFVFNLGISKEEFQEKYEVKNITINDEEINLNKEFYYYPDDRDAFRIDTIHYERGVNEVKILIHNKETNQSYLKKISQELKYTY